ncbi:hypothetical protein D3C72_1569950 [compost metagenome]
MDADDSTYLTQTVTMMLHMYRSHGHNRNHHNLSKYHDSGAENNALLIRGFFMSLRQLPLLRNCIGLLFFSDGFCHNERIRPQKYKKD